jgi:hypothetical protein
VVIFPVIFLNNRVYLVVLVLFLVGWTGQPPCFLA